DVVGIRQAGDAARRFRAGEDRSRRRALVRREGGAGLNRRGVRRRGGRQDRTLMDDDAFRTFERIAHDEIAEGYRDFFTAVTERAIDPLLDAAAVRTDARVLDVATGPGLAAHRAAMRGAKVAGVDIAPRMVAIAAERYPDVEFR